MIESKISSTDLVKIIIFGFLQIPFIGFIGWGGVPVIILLIGFFLTKRDKQISTLQASVNWCKYYSYFLCTRQISQNPYPIRLLLS